MVAFGFTRRNFLKTLGSSAVSLAILGCADTNQTTGIKRKRPNVILIMTDDQGYGDLACHGNKIIQTPNLDKLYEQSVRLTDFHVCPVCTPTRAALMTGRDPLRTGAWGTTWGRSLLRQDEVTIADVFSAGGYRTGMFGKWHLGDNYPFRPQDRGFQETLTYGGSAIGDSPDYWGNDYFDDTYLYNGKLQKFTGYCTDVFFDNAMKFIEANKRRPFFVYLPTNAPHSPYNVDEKYSKIYIDKGVDEKLAAFYGMIANIDENMGRLMRKLKELDIEENTILIFMTDNGSSGVRTDEKGFSIQGFNAAMRGRKGKLYDGGHRVPCFIRWPGGELSGGRDIASLTAHIDIMPSLIDMCGLKKPDGVKFDGRSFMALLRDQTNHWPSRTLVIQYRQSTNPPVKWDSAIVTDRWRLMGGKELYDIKVDPSQKKDVAGNHPEVVSKLREFYEDWWVDVSKRFDEHCDIIIGSNMENPAKLTGFHWHTNRAPWSQGHIHSGVEVDGFIAVQIARNGNYEFELRRWPKEVNQPITAAVDGGKAISATMARLKIAEIDLTKPVPQGANAVVFRVQLKAGRTRLQTRFMDEKTGQSRGVYYVYVRRL